ncbi:MAG: LysM domain-containing protein [Myxococcota bacterium]|jgi:LysM repeat protein|nr:LysM domain-containing protein [Myxococcota bacterium]
MSPQSSLAFDEIPRGTGEVGATQKIARSLRNAGIDPTELLYDEALALARDGHLKPAADRIRMLLLLKPSDGEAALLLGKLLVAREKWQESLAALETASVNGAILPPGLLERAQKGLRFHVREVEAERARLAARERGEVRNLRNEARRLRSDNAYYEQQTDLLKKQVRLWSISASVLGGAVVTFGLASMLLGSEPEATAELSEIQAPTVTEMTPEAPQEMIEPSVTVVEEPVLSENTGGGGPATIELATTPEPTPTPEPVVSPPTTVHTVQSGENLGQIATQYYGRSGAWPKIQEANVDQLHGGTALRVGMELVIPTAP